MIMGWPAPLDAIVPGEREGEGQTAIVVLGIDLGKNWCSLVGLDGRDR